MKVFAVANPRCEVHDNAELPEGELAMFELCVDCDPDRELFRGLESGELFEFVEVVERPDLDVANLAETIMFGIKNFMHADDVSPKRLRSAARADAKRMADAAASYAVGTYFARRGGELHAVSLKRSA